MISTITGKLKKIALLALVCIVIATAFSACRARNLESTVPNQKESNVHASKNVLTFNGGTYPINSSLDFEVKDVIDMDYYEDLGASGITVIMFCSDDYETIDYIDKNYDFSTGPAQAIAFIYDAPYREVVNGNANILGSYKVRYENAYSGYVDGWQIMYDENGEVVFKTDIFSILECGLHEYYYDENDNAIASYYGWDSERENSLWTDRDGNIINEVELITLLENMCPNEYLKELFI
ncbi:MAG: hypothetical protein J1E05_00815 [Eubacterium sp.]|nr:hypothetical protein [Eubacterium sp.]